MSLKPFAAGFAVLLLASAFADEVRDQKIHLPTVPVVVQPVEDTVKPVKVISEDVWYVIESKTPLIVLASPEGVVSVTPDDGPMKIKGKFADGTGKTEVRVYSSPFLYFVNAVKAGTTELICIPRNVENADQIIRHTLTVAGKGPNPPPDVDPDDDTPPEPQPIEPPKGIRVLLLGDETATREQLNTLNSTAIVAWLNENCVKGADGRAEWRRWDRTSISQPGVIDSETPVWRQLWKDVSPKLTGNNLLIVAADATFVVKPLQGPTETLKVLEDVKAGKW